MNGLTIRFPPRQMVAQPLLQTKRCTCCARMMTTNQMWCGGMQYDAGTARIPGQLSHGSGATPTFFGLKTDTDYVMITDNADGRIALIVLDAGEGRLVCRQPIFTDGINSGTENSAIGIGNNVIVASMAILIPNCRKVRDNPSLKALTLPAVWCGCIQAIVLKKPHMNLAALHGKTAFVQPQYRNYQQQTGLSTRSNDMCRMII